MSGGFMKFRENAVARAIYRLLGLFSVLLYLQAISFLALGITTALTSNTTQQVDFSAGYIVAAGVIAIIGERLRSIRSSMTERTESDL
jgi:hypothetical protein